MIGVIYFSSDKPSSSNFKDVEYSFITFVVLLILFYFLASENVLPGAGDLFREINKNKV